MQLNFFYQDIWNAIVTGTKTIETRALNPEEKDRYFGDISVGDVLVFYNKLNSEYTKARVEKIYKWNNLEEYTNTDMNIKLKVHPYKKSEQLQTYDQIKPLFDFTTGYIDKINTNGLIGREFEIVE